MYHYCKHDVWDIYIEKGLSLTHFSSLVILALQDLIVHLDMLKNKKVKVHH